MSKLNPFGRDKAPKANAALLADFFLESADQLHHPVLRKFDFLWRSHAQDGRVPSRQHMAHDALIELLPHLMLLEVSGDGDRLRFRSRLVGQHHVEMNGRSTAGEFIDEAGNDGKVGCVDVEALADVVAAKLPLYMRHRIELSPGRFIDCEGALYPLASDGVNVDRVAAIVVPHYPRPTRTARLFSWF